jgi:hypothetical protein
MRYSTRILKPAIPVLNHPLPARRRSNWSYTDLALNPDDKELYNERIRELEQELEQLNILDHALRIIEICGQIKILRRELEK